MSHLVSVVIPTYNRARYIKKAVESVLAQTYQNLEVLVIDDGSTDSTREIVTGIQDNRVKYVSTKNQGNYFARNEGLKLARGEFIAFLDSDDIFLPQKLEKQLEQFDFNDSLGLCCSNVFVRHDGLLDKVFEDKAHSFTLDFGTKEGFVEQAIKSNFIVTSTVVIRRKCVQKVGCFDTHFQNAMDYEFFLRVIFNFPAKYLKEKLVERFIHPVAVSRDSIVTTKALVYIFSERLDQFRQGALFNQSHNDLLKNAEEKSLYALGLEYLLKYNFKDAYEKLNGCNYKEKRILMFFLVIVARFRLSFLVPLIKQYRTYRNYASMHYSPTC